MPHDKTACPLTVWYIQGRGASAFVFARSVIAAIKAYDEFMPGPEPLTIEPWLKIKESPPE